MSISQFQPNINIRSHRSMIRPIGLLADFLVSAASLFAQIVAHVCERGIVHSVLPAKYGGVKMQAKLLRAVVLCLTLVYLSSSAGHAQTTSGVISGTVQDQSNANIGGANVTARNQENQFVFKTTTNESGRFVFAEVPPGVYTVSVEAQGFGKLTRVDVTLDANSNLDLGDLPMAVGSLVQSVDVSADIVSLKTQDAERSDTLVSQQIENIAVNGRSPLALTELVAGVVSTGNYETAGWGGLGTISANGARSNQNELTINGLSVVDPGANYTQNATISLDSVREFKILTGVYDAQYGRSAGAQINIVTKSGTSQLHGSGYWYYRNQGMNANTWLNNEQGLKRSEYEFQYPGFTIGGPVYIPKLFEHKDKLFFFYSLEFQRQVIPNAITFATVPTQLERQGDFSQTVNSSGSPFPYIKDPASSQPCSAANTSGCFQSGGVLGRIPQSSLYQTGLTVLNLFPAPNAPGNVGFNYQSALSTPNNRREQLARIDYNISDKLHLSIFYIGNSNPVYSPYGEGPGLTTVVPIANVLQNLPGYTSGLGLTWIINNTTTNEVNFGVSHHDQRIYEVGNKLTRSVSGIDLPLLYPNAVVDDYIPSLTFAGTNLSNSPDIDTSDSPWGEFDTTFNITDNLSKSIGNHLIKTGIYIQHNRKNQFSFGSMNGSYNFGDNPANPYDTGYGFANAATGVFQTFSQQSQQVGGNYLYDNIEGYGQDTWNITPRITVNYGLRLAWYQPWYDSTLKASTFVPNQWNASDAPRLYEPALAPNGQRIAYDPVTGQSLPAVDIGAIVAGSGNVTNGILQAGHGISKYLGVSPQLVVGPRLGIAWQLVKDRVVLRTGAGIYHDRIQGNRIFNMVLNPPASVSPIVTYGFVQDLSSGNSVQAPPSLYAFEPKMGLPTVYNYSLDLQTKLLAGFVLDTAYVGNQSRHLQMNLSINPVPYGADFQPQNQDPTLVAANPNAPLGANALSDVFLRPYRGFSNISLYEGTATGNYNSLQVSVQRTLTKGLFMETAYTWSKNLTDSSSQFADFGYGYINPALQHQAFYGPASYDRRQNFVANFIYSFPSISYHSQFLKELENGWQIAGIALFQSGSPFTACFNVSGAGTCSNAQTFAALTGPGPGNPLLTGSQTESARIRIVGNPYTGSGNPFNRLNGAAFAAPLPGSVGLESGFNNLVNPGLDNWQFSLQKRFYLTERVNLQLRLDAFNAFNHPQFTSLNSTLNFSALPNPTPTNYNPGGGISNRNGFGSVNAVADPRILQTMVRFEF